MSPPDPQIEAILDAILAVTEASMGTVTLVDRDRQWSYSRRNIQDSETDRAISFCGHGILQDEFFVVEDARTDHRFYDNPLVTGSQQVVFYGGKQLTTSAGFKLGMLCVMDHRPRQLSETQRLVVERFADNIVSILELRRERARVWEYQREMNHQIQNALQVINSTLHLHTATGFCVDEEGDDWLEKFSDRLESMSTLARHFTELVSSEKVKLCHDVVPIVRTMVDGYDGAFDEVFVDLDSDNGLVDDIEIPTRRALLVASFLYEFYGLVLSARRSVGLLAQIQLLNGESVRIVTRWTRTMSGSDQSVISGDYRLTLLQTLGERLDAIPGDLPGEYEINL